MADLKDLPVYCSIVAAYTEGWTLGISNHQLSPSINAITYAFMRLPRGIDLRFAEKPAFLLTTFLTWNEEITNRLKVGRLKNISAEAYFALNNERRAKQRKSLMRKSIVWCLIEMWLFSRNPKSEWLGNYEKIKSKTLSR